MDSVVVVEKPRVCVLHLGEVLFCRLPRTFVRCVDDFLLFVFCSFIDHYVTLVLGFLHALHRRYSE